MAEPILQKLGDKAKRFASDTKSLLPTDSDVSSLDEKAKQINEYAGEKHSGAAPAAADTTVYPQDKATGSRSLEDRGLKMIDTREMLKPLGQASVPSYDEGTKRVPEDQLAMVHEGEAVVPADENPYNTEQKKEEPVEEARVGYPEISKQMEEAKKKVENPGAQTEQPTPQPEQIQEQPQKPEQMPTASHEERVAIKKDQQDAMGMGVNGLTKLGMANIHARQLGLSPLPLGDEKAPQGFSLDSMKAPKEVNQGATPAAQAPAPAQTGGLKPIAGTETTPDTTQRVNTPDFKAQLAKLKEDHAAALALRTPEGKVKADYIQDQINQLHKDNPYGSAGNHPGFLGKLGHVAAKVGNIAGNVLAPNVMAAIPGTDLNNHLQERAQGAQEDKDVGALADITKADKAAGDAWRPVAGAVGPNGRVPLLNAKTNEVKEAPEGFTPYDKPAHLGDQAQYIDQWYRDHPDAPKSTANDDKAIEAYATAKGAAAQENKAKGKMYYYNTPQGRVGYTYAEAKAAGLNPGEDGVAVSSQEAEKDRKANDTYESLKSIMQQYQGHLAQSEGQLLPTDVDNMSSMIESVEAPDYISKIVTGVVDDLYGKPVTGYNEKLMKGALTKKAYDAMSPAARQLVADYFTTLMAHFGNVKATLGQVPRNEKLITTEMNMIPKPYLNGKEAEPAFNNYTAQVERNNAHNVKFGKQETTQGAAQPEGATHEVVKDGKVIGHVVTGPDGKKKYQPLQQ